MSFQTIPKPSPLPAEMSDRFGPMLVKELRQGLRTKVFLTAFIGFQAILLIMVLAGFASHSAGESSGDFLSNAVWGILMVMLLIITPLRGLFALDKEIRAGTLELLQITNLDAWRIVRGKWGALFGEAMLYLTAALPYFTLRYFLGGVQILTDLGRLSLFALLSGSLTAVIVGLSGFRSMLLRIGTAIGAIALVSMINSMPDPYTSFAAGSGASWLPLIGLVVTLVVVGWSFLQLGARTIATQAENHSSGVRLATFGGLVVVVVLDQIAGSGTSGMIGDFTKTSFFLLAIMIYTCGIFAAITDNSLQSTRIYTPFIRRGVTALGRLLLYPGWGSGLFYIAAMTVPIMMLRLMSDSPKSVMLTTLIIFNLLMQPAVITRLQMRQRGVRLLDLSTYITMLVACAITSTVLVIAEAAMTGGEPTLSMFFPVPAMTGGFREEEVAIGFQVFSAFVCSAILLGAAVEDLAFTTRRENAARDVMAERDAAKRAAAEPQPEAATADAPDAFAAPATGAENAAPPEAESSEPDPAK